MVIVTLTTDLGTRDHYAGAVKGELLKNIPGANIIDISHNIDPFNIFHAAFVLSNCWQSFPAGTFHLIGVNTQERDAPYVVVKHQKQIFIGADNGVFGLLFEDDLPKEIYKIKTIEEDSRNTFPLKNIFVNALRQIVEGKPIEEFTERIDAVKQGAVWLKPTLKTDHIHGNIIYFDHFENAITNISKNDFDQVGKGRKFVIVFKRYDDTVRVSNNYFSVHEGNKVCVFNSSGFLEIAINKGNAKGLFNFNQNDAVRIEFS